LINLSSRGATSSKTGYQEIYNLQKSIKVEKPQTAKRKKTFDKPEILK